VTATERFELVPIDDDAALAWFNVMFDEHVVGDEAAWGRSVPPGLVDIETRVRGCDAYDVKHDGELVGRIALSDHESTDDERDGMELAALWVEPSRRGGLFGSQLVYLAEREVRRRGRRYLLAEVRAWNRGSMRLARASHCIVVGATVWADTSDARRTRLAVAESPVARFKGYDRSRLEVNRGRLGTAIFVTTRVDAQTSIAAPLAIYDLRRAEKSFDAVLHHMAGQGIRTCLLGLPFVGDDLLRLRRHWPVCAWSFGKVL